MSVASVKRVSFDDAMLALIVERADEGLPCYGDPLLAAIIEEATDSLARLKERGLIEQAGEEDA